MRNKLILASKSPQRSELLKKHNVEFTVRVQNVREDDVEGAPHDMVIELSRRKARAVVGEVSEGIVLGADTLVSIGGLALGKPVNGDDARRMLNLLSGRAHEVFTGLCLIDARTGRELTGIVRTGVTFRPLSESEIDNYVETGDPLTRAGAYGIQGTAKDFVESIDGSYENVVGLPVDAVLEMISEVDQSGG